MQSRPHDYFIEDGVHRAVALRENGVRTSIPAILFEAGKSPARIYVLLEQLHSPRWTPNARRNFAALVSWLATAKGRAQMPPLHLQRLGSKGQPPSIPLAQVQIVK